MIRAEEILTEFYKLFPQLYNKGSCGLNMHNIDSHLAYFVRKWGPLWAWSCFPFEDANAAILSSVHGTGDVTQQCIKVREIVMGLKCIDLDRVKTTDKHFISKLMNPLRSDKDSTQYQNCKISGRITAPHRDHKNIDQLLLITGATSAANLSIAHRIQVNGQKLYCKEYSRMKRRVLCSLLCEQNYNEHTVLCIECKFWPSICCR